MLALLVRSIWCALQGACSLDIDRRSRFVGRAKLRLSRDRGCPAISRKLLCHWIHG